MLETFCNWLSTTGLSLAFQGADWFVPSVQTIHILCIAALLIPVLQMSDALLRQRDVARFARLVRLNARRVWPLLLMLLLTGILLTITEPSRELLNWVFRTKMILVAILASIIYGLSVRARNNREAANKSRVLNVSTAVLLIVLVVAIVTAGRWIAYT